MVLQFVYVRTVAFGLASRTSRPHRRRLYSTCAVSTKSTYLPRRSSSSIYYLLPGMYYVAVQCSGNAWETEVRAEVHVVSTVGEGTMLCFSSRFVPCTAVRYEYSLHVFSSSGILIILVLLLYFVLYIPCTWLVQLLRHSPSITTTAVLLINRHILHTWQRSISVA